MLDDMAALDFGQTFAGKAKNASGSSTSPRHSSVTSAGNGTSSCTAGRPRAPRETRYS